MKKLIPFLAGILFLFFSCASTEGLESDSENALPENEITEEITNDTNNPDDNNSDETSPDEIQLENIVNEKEAANNLEDYEQPSDFEEPFVQDLEPAPEKEEIEAEEESPSTQPEEEAITPAQMDLQPSENDNNQNPQGNQNTADILNDQPADELPILLEEDKQNAEAMDDKLSAEQEKELSASEEDPQQDSSDLKLEQEEAEDTTSQEEAEDPQEETYEIEELPEEEIQEFTVMPSRSVTLKRGESLEVVYPGSGWIYMGSLSEYNNLASRGRKLGASDTKYTLLAKEAGTQIHHFYKVDNLTGEYIDDYLEVIVLDKKGSSKTKVTAPAYEAIIPPKAESPAKAKPAEEKEITTILDKNEDEQADFEENTEGKNTKLENAELDKEKVETKERINQESQKQAVAEIETKPESQASEGTDEVAEADEVNEADEIIDVISIDDDFSTYTENTSLLDTIDTDSLLENAKNLYNEEKYQEANLLLAEFFEYSTYRIDEGLFLQGQIYEADSEIKDIKKSIENYEALIKNYPASEYWNDANKRIKYLKKFYYLSN